MKKGRGFCLPHFGDLIEAAEDKLTDDEKKEFYPKAFSMMQDNLDRLQKEVSWFVEKNDYRNKDKDWGAPPTASSAACRSAPAAIPPDEVFKAKL